ncbi:MAG: leucine-rich repeat protein [Bacteroidaceae bacterium]|nr:leucine-rich repeat protein [Bacteroidaceae bacterium]
MRLNYYLCLFLFLIGARISVSAEYATIDGLEYNLNPDTHEAILHRGTTWEGELIIPSGLNYEGQEYTVTTIESFSFFTNITMTSVTIPSTVTSIGESAFCQCSRLTSVIISEGVKSIGQRAFYLCTNLSNIIIPKSVTRLDHNVFEETAWYNNHPDGLVYAGRVAYRYKGNAPKGSHITISEGTCEITKNAFRECLGLTSVTIPESVNKIGEDAFSGCSDLESINIPVNLSSIEDRCFYGCSNLKSIVIPESVKRIGYSAFSGCTSLSLVNIPNGITTIYDGTFNNCSSLAAIDIPKSVIRICDMAFSNTSLKSITIPKKVADIGDSAFEGCDKITDVYIPSRYAPFTRKDVFKGASIASATLHVPANSIGDYQATSPWSGFGDFIGLTPANIEINELNFPDRNFRSWLRAQEYGNDDVITDAEIVNLKGINVNGQNIRSLKGIEYFTELTRLECNNNQLTTLDLSECSELYLLRCNNNQLTSLDVSQNTELKELQCNDNQLTTLNVMGCTSLDKLYCSNNKLTALNVSGCDMLKYLFCSNNQLKELDVSDTKILGLECYQNRIKGTAMDALVESLPIGGQMYAISNENEQNEMTTEQVATAYSKNWVIYYTPNGRSWRQYAGSEPKEYASFTKDQIATIILPTTPDPVKGKYYRLDRSEKNQIIFVEEPNPQAHTPYIILPNENFSVDLSTLNLVNSHSNVVSVPGVSFIGSYLGEEIEYQDGCYIDIIDHTPDCREARSIVEKSVIGALHAYLRVHWEDPYNPGGTRSATRSVTTKIKKAIVLEDNPNGTTGIDEIQNSQSENQDDAVYDLAGRRVISKSKIQNSKLPKGIYIIDGKQVLVK